MNIQLIQEVKTAYNEKFGVAPEIVVRAPGRINLLGEHTDYNDGFVLPGAIDKAIYIALGHAEGSESCLYSLDFDESIIFSAEAPQVSKKSWSNYVQGVVKQLLDRGLALKNFQATFSGDIPVGSGLSSSAALECGFGYGLNQLFSGSLSREEIAKAGQQAEHDFVGVKCGIMDQFASSMGKEGHVFKLDCRSLAYSYHPLDLKEYDLVLFNTMVHHNLASSEYNKRREDCENGIATLQKHGFDVSHLRDVTVPQLNKVQSVLSETVYKRCKYVIEENERVEQVVDALDRHDLRLVGELMFATHQGLSNGYEVSCEELDYLVSLVESEQTVLGARMMGGGFGGCTINMVKKDDIDRIGEIVNKSYQNKFGKPIESYRVKLDGGVKSVD